MNRGKEEEAGKGAGTARAASPRSTRRASGSPARSIEDIECVVPDQAGVARGKMMPVAKFLAGPTMSMPGSIFTQTIAGDWPDDDESFENDPADQDILLEPDFSTLAVVPWEEDPTAQLIHDAYHADGRPVEIAPRQVLRRIVELYAQPRLAAGGGAGDRVLSGQAEQRPRLSAGAAEPAARAGRSRRASPIRSPRSTSSTSCSTTSTTSPKRRASRSTR